MSPERSEMLSVTEAAKILGLQPAMTRRHCENGRLKAEKIGNYWAIPLKSLKDFETQRNSKKSEKDS